LTGRRNTHIERAEGRQEEMREGWTWNEKQTNKHTRKKKTHTPTEKAHNILLPLATVIDELHGRDGLQCGGGTGGLHL
jgi:hypothetical protein